MHIVVGILLLVVGVAYPMAALFWLNRRMARLPALTPRQVGLLLAFNGILPVGLILTGIAALIPRLWNRIEFKTGAGMAGLAALVLLLLLLAARRTAGTAGAGDGRSTHGG